MRRLLPALLLLLLPAPVGAQDASVPAAPSGGWTAAPDFRLMDSAGGRVRLSDHRGRVVVLQFWARWCSSCEGDLKLFERIRERIPDADLVILGLGHSSGSRGEIRAFGQTLGITYPLLLCPDSTKSAYNVAVFPTTFLLDRQGRIRQRRIGALEDDYWESQIRELMAEGEARGN